MSDIHDRMELELRSVPGVDGVGFTEEGGALVIQLVSSDVAVPPDARRQVAQLVRAHIEGPALVEFGGPASEPPVRTASPSSNGARVQLLEVRKVTFTQEVEVHLAHGPHRTVGRADAASPVAAVTATLDALEALGAHVSFRADAATMAVGRDFDPAVVVMLEPENGDRTCYGVGRAATLEQAACHATLHALNRYLGEPGVFSRNSPA